MRRAADGRVVVPGHRGLIYLAKGLVSLGRSAASRMLILPDGTALDRRALAKLRRDDCGHDYVERRLARFGAAARRPGESGAAYLARALPQAGVVVLRHGGCYRYACPLGMTRTERAASASACPPAPRPRRSTRPVGRTPSR